MSVYKDEKTNTWRVIYRYTDWTGVRKQTQKRGFATRREAVAWEHEQIAKTESSLDMTFGSFVELYISDIKPRIRENTWESKEHIIRTKIVPYFKDRKLAEIQARDVVAWQNELLSLKQKNGKPYSQTYLKTLHNQMSAIFNHAVKFYGVNKNPARITGNMGKEESKEMLIWTQEEYKRFSEAMMDKPMSFYAFEVLYWTGMREGELLALTSKDFDLENKTVTINKSYQRLKGQNGISSPKTPKSNRVIKIPDFLVEEIEEYINALYGITDKDRLFPVTKSTFTEKWNVDARRRVLRKYVSMI